MNPEPPVTHTLPFSPSIYISLLSIHNSGLVLLWIYVSISTSYTTSFLGVLSFQLHCLFNYFLIISSKSGAASLSHDHVGGKCKTNGRLCSFFFMDNGRLCCQCCCTFVFLCVFVYLFIFVFQKIHHEI